MISGQSGVVSDHAKEKQQMSLYEEHCVYLVPMLGWFLFSTLLVSYNKKVFGAGDMAFPCPLLMTSIHFCAQWIFSEAVCGFWPEWSGSDRISHMSWKEYASLAVPCGLVTSADIGLSNLSWATLTLTFYTMIKSSAPIFVLFWAYLFGIAKITRELIAVIALITLGEFVTVKGQQDQGDFHVSGFILCLCATILSGARWTLVQLKIQSLQPPITSTIATMRLLAPSMFVSLFITSLLLERPWIRLAPLTTAGAVTIVALGLFGAFFAIAMILCELHLIRKANAIVLTIGGVIKEVLTILVGVLFFKDQFTGQSALGCTIILVGVLLYKFTFSKQKNDTQHNYHNNKNSNNNTNKLKQGGSRDGSYADDDDDDDYHETSNGTLPTHIAMETQHLLSRPNANMTNMDDSLLPGIELAQQQKQQSNTPAAV